MLSQLSFHKQKKGYRVKYHLKGTDYESTISKLNAETAAAVCKLLNITYTHTSEAKKNIGEHASGLTYSMGACCIADEEVDIMDTIFQNMSVGAPLPVLRDLDTQAAVMSDLTINQWVVYFKGRGDKRTGRLAFIMKKNPATCHIKFCYGGNEEMPMAKIENMKTFVGPTKLSLTDFDENTASHAVLAEGTRVFLCGAQQYHVVRIFRADNKVVFEGDYSNHPYRRDLIVPANLALPDNTLHPPTNHVFPPRCSACKISHSSELKCCFHCSQEFCDRCADKAWKECPYCNERFCDSCMKDCARCGEKYCGSGRCEKACRTSRKGGHCSASVCRTCVFCTECFDARYE